MILDQLNEELKNKIISNLNDSVKSAIENSTVLLRSATFTGSGVIFFKDTEKKKFYVLTAKHNLLVAAKGAHAKIVSPATWDVKEKEKNSTTLKDYFKANVGVIYKGANMTKKEPELVNVEREITDIKLIDDWSYDVCQLEITYTNETTPRGSLLGPQDIKQLKELVKGQQDFILDLAKYVKSKDQISGITKYQFLQTGYGVPSLTTNKDQYLGKLENYKIKAVEFDSFQPRDVYEESVSKYQDVFTLKSNQNCTTLPGDSGGPVFGVVLGEEKFALYLVGLTLGSDYFLRQQDEPATLQTDPDGKYNNGSTSLSKYYAYVQ